MKPPEGVKVNEDHTSTWWIDKEGMVCSVSKSNGIDNTREGMISQFTLFKKANEDKKICILFDISYARPDKEVNREREILMDELENVIKAMAIISTSALGRLLANLFFNLKSPSFPMKIFKNEQEAREWLINYM